MHALVAALALVYAVAGSQQQGEQAHVLAGVVLAEDPIWLGDEGVEVPRLTGQVYPEHSPSAVRAGVTGTVYIGGILTDSGRVWQPKLIVGLSDEELNQRALEAIRQWEFEPALSDGRPVPLAGVFAFRFEVRRLGERR